MNIKNNVNNPERQRTKLIGKVEYKGTNLYKFLQEMMQSMAMLNPSGFPSSSSKGIQIIQNGSAYQIVLSMFEPPYVIEWTSPISIEMINEEIENKIVKGKKILAYISNINLGKSTLVQFAISA